MSLCVAVLHSQFTERPVGQSLLLGGVGDVGRVVYQPLLQSYMLPRRADPMSQELGEIVVQWIDTPCQGYGGGKVGKAQVRTPGPR